MFVCVHGVAHGVDTVGYAFRGLCLREARDAFSGPRADEMTGQVVTPVDRGRTTTLTVPRQGPKVGLTVPPSGEPLVWCEGRLSDLLRRDSVLCGSSLLAAGEAAARDLASRLGVPIEGCEATVRRCDLATDIAFDEPSDAFGFLRGVSTLVLPRHSAEVHNARGTNAVETVAWRNGGGGQLRAYDKTLERGQRGGGVVRIERHGGHARESSFRQRSSQLRRWPTSTGSLSALGRMAASSSLGRSTPTSS